MSYQKALERFTDLINASSTGIEYLPSRNGPLIRDGRDDDVQNPQRHIWIAAQTPNKKWKATLQYRASLSQPWTVVFGECHEKGNFRNRSTAVRRTFDNPVDAELYFVNKVWPAIVTMD